MLCVPHNWQSRRFFPNTATSPCSFFCEKYHAQSFSSILFGNFHNILQFSTIFLKLVCRLPKWRHLDLQSLGLLFIFDLILISSHQPSYGIRITEYKLLAHTRKKPLGNKIICPTSSSCHQKKTSGYELSLLPCPIKLIIPSIDCIQILATIKHLRYSHICQLDPKPNSSFSQKEKFASNLIVASSINILLDISSFMSESQIRLFTEGNKMPRKSFQSLEIKLYNLREFYLKLAHRLATRLLSAKLSGPNAFWGSSRPAKGPMDHPRYHTGWLQIHPIVALEGTIHLQFPSPLKAFNVCSPPAPPCTKMIYTIHNHPTAI
ncbi:hypothetical protein VP01_5741g1 [Puccinia sorghi]|uniref:Uncharacterized protein n=1 Tax=Puccinia sorghi TaxID=27349 RepID=A0A0L6UIL8_9BASI|nr:hypothetical protein VP01_5741g1 [Puccinia sorghi]